MYRFNSDDNLQAAHFFKMALAQDRTFARAHACLSFTHFQNAFLHHTEQREHEIALAYDTAGEGLVADDRDPAAHWAMGRALVVTRRAVEIADRAGALAVALSPNFALGHYTLGFVHSQSGDSRLAIASTDYSRHLSPFDPLLFAMLASRGMALLRLGRYRRSSGCGEQGGCPAERARARSGDRRRRVLLQPIGWKKHGVYTRPCSDARPTISSETSSRIPPAARCRRSLPEERRTHRLRVAALLR